MEIEALDIVSCPVSESHAVSEAFRYPSAHHLDLLIAGKARDAESRRAVKHHAGRVDRSRGKGLRQAAAGVGS